MSACGAKRTIAIRSCDVHFWPKADVAHALWVGMFFQASTLLALSREPERSGQAPRRFR
jgi:hypothetical protein